MLIFLTGALISSSIIWRYCTGTVMKKLTLLSMTLFSQLCFADIGIVSESYLDTVRDRKIDTNIFYPTKSDQKQQTFAENAAFYGIKAVKNAIIKGDKLPVYFLVHGTSGNWKNQSWLAKELANKGALVIAANHPGYTSGEASPINVLRMWEQPRDVSFLIDQVLSGKYASVIDSSNITVIGYSLGGYTAMALAGVRFDILGFEKFCISSQDKSCRYFSDAFTQLTKEDRSMITASYKDSRVTHSIAITPGYIPAIQANSLAELNTKTLIIGAELDKNVPPNTQLLPYLQGHMGNIVYREISQASHFSFLQNCKPKAASILEEDAFVCKELGNKKRKTIHKELSNLIQQWGKM
jgi:predicted dienelactone hydrolase